MDNKLHISDCAGLFMVSKADGFCNARLKINPRTGEAMEACIASRPLFNPLGLESREKVVRYRPLPGRELWETEEASGAMGDRWEQVEAEGKRRSAARAKRRLFDIALCNDFDLFFTLTLSPQEIDRYDYGVAVKRLSVWLDNRVRRNGLRYVAVPELHKDGAIHFHGLCNKSAVKLQNSGKRSKGKTVYNITDWSLGFTTAVRLSGEYGAVCRYISKYVTKQSDCGTIGGRYYFHGGKLQEPVYRYGNADMEGAKGKTITIDEAGLDLLYLDEPSEMAFVEER